MLSGPQGLQAEGLPHPVCADPEQAPEAPSTAVTWKPLHRTPGWGGVLCVASALLLTVALTSSLWEEQRPLVTHLCCHRQSVPGEKATQTAPGVCGVCLTGAQGQSPITSENPGQNLYGAAECAHTSHVYVHTRVPM